MNNYSPVFDSEFLRAAELIAAEAHGQQQRQFENAPYWRHLQRVAQIVRDHTGSEILTAAALFHDVLEDTSWTAELLKERIAAISSPQEAGAIIELVRQLTDEYIKDNYPEWNRGQRKKAEAERLAKVSADAQTIKYADIMDNSRSLHTGKSFAFKYLNEAIQLLQMMKKGDPELRALTLEVVKKEMEKQNITIPPQ